MANPESLHRGVDPPVKPEEGNDGVLKLPLRVKKLFLDIGNVYTKFIIQDRLEKNNAEKSHFLSAVSIYPPPDTFSEFGERIYLDPEEPSKSYLVGWPAALVTDQVLGITLNSRHLRLLLAKVLFDRFEDGDQIEVFLTYDFGEISDHIQNLAQSLDGKPLTLSAGTIFEDQNHPKTVHLKVHPLASPLSLFGYYRKSSFANVPKNFSMLIIDSGYVRSKVFIVNRQKGLERFSVLDIGTKMVYKQIDAHFREMKCRLNSMILMRGLEINYPIVTLNQKKYNVEKIMRNICWDLNKEIIPPLLKLLQDYYSSHACWVDALVVTGGGSVFSGDLLLASLADRNVKFFQTFVDKNSRFAVLDGILAMDHGGTREKS